MKVCLGCLVMGWLAWASPWISGARGNDDAPPIPREFRAGWVATVGNIDWPSRPGLPADDQKREAVAILDKAQSVGLNALVLQVRAAADAFYDSPIEPWSSYLTGRQGESPGYDPLAFWVDQAHRRGLLLHAWINPYRARIASAKYVESASHVSRTHPEIVRKYGASLWLDPGEPEARALTIRVVADIARRYDVDGLHIDDYFYPYPIKDPDRPGQELAFPDDASWRKALAGGLDPSTNRDDWRRQNVSALVEGMARAVKAEKPRAMFGISPFGIARPGRPAGVVGFDQHTKLFADAEGWFRDGLCDYLAPQLYWKLDAPGQPFRPLVEHWRGVNPARHLWPGLAPYRVGDGPKGYEPGEIVRQVEAIRELTPDDPGAILFSFRSLMTNPRGIADRLAEGPYRAPAIIPRSPWIEGGPPRPPRSVSASAGEGRVDVRVEPDGEPPFLVVVQARAGGKWSEVVMTGDEARLASIGVEGRADRVEARSVDRLGNVSDPVFAIPGRKVGP